MPSPKKIAEPHKELRFTRASQAQTFIIASAIALSLSLLLLLTWLMDHPDLAWWMPLIPLGLSTLLASLAIRCARHAYLILTPLGIEIFPLIKPQKNLNLIYWTQLQEAAFDPKLTILKLHFNPEKTAGIILSLKPILPKKRPLLKKAILGRLSPEKNHPPSS